MKHKKFLPKKHTGKLAPRHHTAYSALALVLVLVLMPLTIVSRGVASAASDPVTTTESTYAVVAGPKPETAPILTSPQAGAVFTTTDLVSVVGSCPDGTLLKVYKNNVLAGATFCQNGHFSVLIDLFLGTNNIVARAYNAANVPSPDSASLTVMRSVPGQDGRNPDALSGQFFVTSEVYYKGVNVGDSLKWPLTLSGGQAPYAVQVGWGDGKTDLISRDQAGTFTIAHTYDKAGSGYRNSYDVTVQASDQGGTTSFIHLVTIVSGTPGSVVGSVKTGYNLSSTIRIAWQLLVLAGGIILVFWLGEKYETRVLKKKYHIAS